MLYGYAIRTCDDNGLLELSEATIAASPETLRLIARFLLNTADELEEKTVSQYWHRHLSDSEGWRSQFPNHDIIVVRPELDAAGEARSDGTGNG